VVRFQVNAKGRVVNPKATGLDEKLQDCVRRQVVRIRFPKPKDGGTVDVTMSLILAKR